MIRKFSALLIVFSLHGLLFFAAAQQSKFDRANELMQNQQIDEAVEIYRSIEMEGFRSGKLYYNMGLASMYQDSLGLAKYYMLQAAGYRDSNTEAKQALGFLDQQFERRSAVLPKLPWERLFHWLEQTFGAVTLMVLAIFIFNVAAGSIIASWFTNRPSSWLRYTGISAGILSLLLILFSICLNHLETQYKTAVMTDRQSSVYERPDSSSMSVSAAYEGYVMTVDRRMSSPETDWYYVRLENGLYGWVSRESVRTF